MLRSSHPIIVLVYVFLLALGLVTVVAGLVGLVSVTEIWWAFGLMAAGGALVLGGAIRGIVAWGKSVDADEATAHQMLTAARSGEAPAGARRGTGPVLAHWTYAPAEWRAWADGELRYLTRESLGMFATVAVLGTLLVGVLKGVLEGEWRTGMIISFATGALIGGGRWVMALLAHHRNRAVMAGEVIVGPTAMLVNGRYEPVHDGDRGRVRFSRAYVREGAGPPLLVVGFTVPGRYRRLPDEYRIPIPAGRVDEARAVAEALVRAHAALPPGPPHHSPAPDTQSA